MDDDTDAIRQAPAAEWIVALERARSDVAADRTVPLQPVLARLEEAATRFEAERIQRAAARSGQ